MSTSPASSSASTVCASTPAPRSARARVSGWAAHAEGALRRAVRLADGWMGAGAADADVFAAQLATVRRLLEEEGRDPATFALSKRVYVSVDEDAGRARERAADAGLAASAIAGRPEEVRARAEELLALGLDHLLLDPVAQHAEHLEALAPLASRGAG